jgi:hypothetical protein
LLFDRPGLRRELHIGRELAKLFREGLHRNRAAWAVFLPAYFSALNASRPRRIVLRALFHGVTALRMVRKLLTLQPPWS